MLRLASPGAPIYASGEEVAAREAWVLVAGANAGSARAVAGVLGHLGRVRRLGAPPAASVLKSPC